MLILDRALPSALANKVSQDKHSGPGRLPFPLNAHAGEHARFVGIEKDEESFALCKSRLAAITGLAFNFGPGPLAAQV